MEEKFKKWISEFENKADGTVYSYAKSINKVSEHYSQHKGSPINIFEISDFETIQNLILQYDFGGKYEDFGNKGNRTYINGLKTYSRFLSNTPKKTGSRSSNNFEYRAIKSATSNHNDLINRFDTILKEEAINMSTSYQLFYCLEVSIRNLIKTTMENNYGKEWWQKVDVRVKDNVKNNLAYELDMPHSKRSDNNIDYTTFGDLRKIINSNWSIFQHDFCKNLNSVNEVMINLNRLRVPIAHCTPLVDKEVKRLEIYVDDWFELLNDN
ncbi:Swt1 family HEPN domain-containing protein [Gelidibacter sp.]|uniref:Swt1 family HEPN domain-containing protein n=1 Tax=Gelidibacter sp. TaxID=2018083 RepID=UPI002C3D0A8D|nr:Swt1 family HEPN domain-containing protein [Gelidibacter sp.]HUH27701.1 Swt1 family HEPN domain-containing protein [Gelidibacter sp.]